MHLAVLKLWQCYWNETKRQESQTPFWTRTGFQTKSYMGFWTFKNSDLKSELRCFVSGICNMATLSIYLLIFTSVYDTMCAGTSGDQQRVLAAQSCTYKHLWATQSGCWEPNLGPLEQQ